MLLAAVLAVPLAGGGPAGEPAAKSPAAQPAAGSGGEVHLANIRQLTFGGENAEAYFSFNGQKIHLPVDPRRGAVRPDLHDEPGRLGPAHGQHQRRAHHLRLLLSGRASRSSTPRRTWAAPSAPPPPSFRMGYVWAIYDSYDIFRANPDGTRADAG